MTIRQERRPLDITHHVDTPGVPVSVRYVVELIAVDASGAETVLQTTIETDSQASAETVAGYLGDALASGRAEESRALAAEAAAIAARDAAIERADALAADLAALRAQLGTPTGEGA